MVAVGPRAIDAHLYADDEVTPRRPKKRRRMTPLEAAAEEVHRVNNSDDGPQAPANPDESGYRLVQASAPAFRPIDPADLSPDLCYQRERAYALCARDRFERWLARHVAEHRIPLDGCATAVTLLVLWVEVGLMAAVTWPELYAPAVDDEDDEADDSCYQPRTETEALEHGLTIRAHAEPVPAATLPGCQGRGDDGGPCQKLRPYGNRFCRRCERTEKRRLKAVAEA